jgi:hypothetical protein
MDQRMQMLSDTVASYAPSSESGPDRTQDLAMSKRNACGCEIRAILKAVSRKEDDHDRRPPVGACHLSLFGVVTVVCGTLMHGKRQLAAAL